MLKKAFLLVVLVCFYFVKGYTQDYFQQEVNYTIDVSLNDHAHTLSAFEEIQYINNSKDTLTFIYFHLWPNAYKNNGTALAKQLLENGETKFYYADTKDKGYIDSLNFQVNEQNVKWQLDSLNIDIAKIILNEPLLPGKQIKITTPFKVKLPKGIFSRMGHLGESYQITQWYPKPAVYDKYGWHPMPYLDQGEFYSEYGTFDVKVTLPANYVVGATGDIINGEREYAWLDSIAEATKLINDFGSDMTFPRSSRTLKTLHYHQEKVHDFAWFADKRYHVLKGKVALPHSGDSVTTWAMFTNNETDLWERSIEYLNDAIYYYSLWNGDYPYSHATAVDGALSAGGGMEYPNVTIIGESGNAFGLETVIMHEVGHNWFYGILGSNERLHPWMDEGLNSFNEGRYIHTKYPNTNLFGDSTENTLSKLFKLNRYSHKHQYYLGYLYNAATNKDQPVEYHSKDYTYFNYGAIVYGKSAIVFNYLQSYLGENVFDECMQLYYDRWKFKHPQPEDLKAVFEEVTQQDLDWFFNDVINTTKKIDYKITKAKNDQITIKNKGEIVSPFSVSYIDNNNISNTVWFSGVENKTTLNYNFKKGSLVKIDALETIPEVNRNNNSLKLKGLFKQVEPLTFQLLGGIDNPDKTQIFFSPIAGYNTTNGFMCGLALYNHLAPQKKWEYVFAPMYAFNSQTITGTGMISYNKLMNKSFIRQITYSITGSSFSYQSYLDINKPYYKVAPQIHFYFNKKEMRSPQNHELALKAIGINEPIYLYMPDQINTSINNVYGLITYRFDHNTALKKYQNIAEVELNKNFSKISTTSKLDIPYKNERKGIHFRLFAGGFLFNNSNDPRYNFRMDGSNGFYDYKFNYLQLDRSNFSSVLSNQLIDDQGGFKILAPAGQSNQWIVSLNGKAELPIPLPLGMFVDLGTNSYKEFLADAGAYIYIVKNIAEIYLPLLYTNNIKSALGNNKGLELIRFTLNLNMANPFQIIKEFNF